MAKLHFRYGTIGSGKTLDLLKVSFNYEENNMNALLLTSKIDDRYGHDIIKSRTGVHKDAIGIDINDDVYSVIDYNLNVLNKKIDCVLVDEVQFFTKKHIHQMSDVVDKMNIPVICYGLRADFKLDPFGSSQYLMAIADELEEMKTICSKCGKKKATVNARYINDKVVTEGPQIEIGGNEKYKPMCRNCYKKSIKK
jgi:thymidine kinase